MNIEFKVSIQSLFNTCFFCSGTGKVRAMQMAMTYNKGPVRTEDTKVKCINCNGKGFK